MPNSFKVQYPPCPCKVWDKHHSLNEHLVLLHFSHIHTTSMQCSHPPDRRKRGMTKHFLLFTVYSNCRKFQLKVNCWSCTKIHNLWVAPSLFHCSVMFQRILYFVISILKRFSANRFCRYYTLFYLPFEFQTLCWVASPSQFLLSLWSCSAFHLAETIQRQLLFRYHSYTSLLMCKWYSWNSFTLPDISSSLFSPSKSWFLQNTYVHQCTTVTPN